jgi:hypothetical protein
MSSIRKLDKKVMERVQIDEVSSADQVRLPPFAPPSGYTSFSQSCDIV